MGVILISILNVGYTM